MKGREETQRNGSMGVGVWCVGGVGGCAGKESVGRRFLALNPLEEIYSNSL